MNALQQVKNDFTSAVDATGIKKRDFKSNLKNTLKTVIKVQPAVFGSSSNVFGKVFLFDIPKNHNGLSQMFIKATIACTGDNSASQTNLGARIFKEIIFRTKNGTVLQRIEPYYTYARLDELKNTPLDGRLESAIEPKDAFNNTTTSLMIPIFSFLADQELNPKALEGLCVECRVNDSFTAMGLDATLTSAYYELYCVFFDSEDEGLKERQEQKQFMITDTYSEPIVPLIPTGSTSYRFLLSCPEIVSSTTFTLYTDNQEVIPIDTIKFESRGTVLAEVDRRMNYSLSEQFQEVSELNAGPLTYFWSRERSRNTYSGHMLFTGPMYPVYAVLEFGQLNADFYLSVIHETKNIINISETGVITRPALGYFEPNL